MNTRHRKHRWKAWVSVAFVALISIMLLCLNSCSNIENFVSPGPIHHNHRALNCRDCHAGKWEGGRKLWGESRAQMNQACARCHDGLPNESHFPLLEEAPRNWHTAFSTRVAPHSPRQLLTEESDCANCHRDHRGGRTLIQTSNQKCTNCHKSLSFFVTEGSPLVAPHVTGFEPGEHPGFEVPNTSYNDPGVLRFNHKKHLELGSKGSVGGLSKPLQRLKEKNCRYCHQADPEQRLMLPITYEQHCQECHPLTVPLTGRKDHRAERAWSEFAQVPAPHVEPAKVRQAMIERLSSAVISSPGLLRDPGGPRPLPGRSPIPPKIWEQSKWVEMQQTSIERKLFGKRGQCQFCHLERNGISQRNNLPVYHQTSLPKRWMYQANFHHGKHSRNCFDCHNAQLSEKTSDVLMPSMHSCVNCHGESIPTPPGGATSNCTQCHSYHG